MSPTDPMAIAESVAVTFSAQPELFGAAAFSAEEQATLRVARYGDYTGKLVTRDQVRVATVVALRQQGASFREIQRRTGMDHRLIHRVLEYAEKLGHVPALKDVLNRRIAEVTELAADRLADEIRRDEPDPQLVKSLAVAYGVGADKTREAAVSVSGDLHIHQSVTVEGVDPAREWLRARAARLSTDSHAAGAVCNSLPGNGGSSVGAVVAACEVQPIEVPALVVESSGEAGDQAAEGGGGGRDSRRPPTDQMANHSTTS